MGGKPNLKTLRKKKTRKGGVLSTRENNKTEREKIRDRQETGMRRTGTQKSPMVKKQKKRWERGGQAEKWKGGNGN